MEGMDGEGASNGGGKCPVMHGAAPARKTTTAGGRSNRDWWPNQLNQIGRAHV